MGKNISRRLKLNRLSNTRDIGGIVTAEGAGIVKNRLFRSGQLYFADADDIACLSSMEIKLIFDFRSAPEQKEKPDPRIGEALHINMPIVEDVTAGISRDQKSDVNAFDAVIRNCAEDPDFGIRYMADTYLQLAKNDFCKRQYGSFLRQVLEQEEGAVLWHCTAGKDRAGIAAVLIEEILGVHRDDIYEDYLATNEYLEPEIDRIMVMLGKKMNIDGAEKGIRDFFGAREEYLRAVYRIMDKEYGGAVCYIRDALNFSENDQRRLRERYLI